MERDFLSAAAEMKEAAVVALILCKHVQKRFAFIWSIHLLFIRAGLALE